MKICIVNGQNHKGSTYHIGRMLAEKINGEITEFFLPRDFGEFCCGCTNCFMKGADKCPHYEKLSPITKSVDDADLIILTSPVYVYHCTGSMKAWLDHYGWRWIIHRPEEKMFSKQAVVISTAAGAGMRSTNKDMADSLSFWGVPRIYKLGVPVMACGWDEVNPSKKQKLEQKTERIAKKILRNKIKPRVSPKGWVFFTAMHFANRAGWNSADSEYWKAKGWTEKKRPWR